MFVVVPNELRDAINVKLDAALAGHPEATEKDRRVLYGQLLSYFNEHGCLPDFTVTKKEAPHADGS